MKSPFVKLKAADPSPVTFAPQKCVFLVFLRSFVEQSF